MDSQLRTQLLAGLTDGSIVPYLGPGVLKGEDEYIVIGGVYDIAIGTL